MTTTKKFKTPCDELFTISKKYNPEYFEHPKQSNTKVKRVKE